MAHTETPASSRSEVLLDAFRQMTLIELHDFVKAFEAEFGVVATVPEVTAPQGTSELSEETEEQSEFTVTLDSHGPQKIQVIKTIRSLTGLGLKEAKDLVDGAPQAVSKNVAKDAADKAKEALEAAGASVTIS
jgi:large subunit ribosomal protein L7/L12